MAPAGIEPATPRNPPSDTLVHRFSVGFSRTLAFPPVHDMGGSTPNVSYEAVKISGAFCSKVPQTRYHTPQLSSDGKFELRCEFVLYCSVSRYGGPQHSGMSPALACLRRNLVAPNRPLTRRQSLSSLVEAAGIEPASEGTSYSFIHAYQVKTIVSPMCHGYWKLFSRLTYFLSNSGCYPIWVGFAHVYC
jgi:hypothetical protein